MELAGLTPQVAIDRVEVEPKGSNIWKVNIWVVNKGFFPYPTHQGERCKRPVPVVVTLDGKSAVLLQGKPRTVLGLLAGSGGTGKASWILRAKKGDRVTIRVQGLPSGKCHTIVTLKGGGK